MAITTLGLENITDGTSKTLLVGEINYGLQEMTWTDCADRAGSPKWGDHTWAQGYWALSWGHMSAEVPDLYNNSHKYTPPYSASSLSQRSPRWSSVRASGWFGPFLDRLLHPRRSAMR